jgi:hypothetical protein
VTPASECEGALVFMHTWFRRTVAALIRSGQLVQASVVTLAPDEERVMLVRFEPVERDAAEDKNRDGARIRDEARNGEGAKNRGEAQSGEGAGAEARNRDEANYRDGAEAEAEHKTGFQNMDGAESRDSTDAEAKSRDELRNSEGASVGAKIGDEARNRDGIKVEAMNGGSTEAKNMLAAEVEAKNRRSTEAESKDRDTDAETEASEISAFKGGPSLLSRAATEDDPGEGKPSGRLSAAPPSVSGPISGAISGSISVELVDYDQTLRAQHERRLQRFFPSQTQPPPQMVRMLPVVAAVRRSTMEIGQRSINFGGCAVRQLRENTVLLHNRSAAPLLFKVRGCTPARLKEGCGPRALWLNSKGRISVSGGMRLCELVSK